MCGCARAARAADGGGDMGGRAGVPGGDHGPGRRGGERKPGRWSEPPTCNLGAGEHNWNTTISLFRGFPPLEAQPTPDICSQVCTKSNSFHSGLLGTGSPRSPDQIERHHSLGLGGGLGRRRGRSGGLGRRRGRSGGLGCRLGRGRGRGRGRRRRRGLGLGRGCGRGRGRGRGIEQARRLEAGPRLLGRLGFGSSLFLRSLRRRLRAGCLRRLRGLCCLGLGIGIGSPLGHLNLGRLIR